MESELQESGVRGGESRSKLNLVLSWLSSLLCFTRAKNEKGGGEEELTARCLAVSKKVSEWGIVENRLRSLGQSPI